MKHLLIDLVLDLPKRPRVVRLIQWLRQAALLPLLLPLLALLLAKLNLHWNAVTLIDQWQRQLPAAVEFEFADIDSSFDGGIELHQARLLLPGMSQPLEFRSLQLQLEHWRDADQLQQGLSQQRLPASVQLDFSLTTASLERLASVEALPVDLSRQLLGCYAHADQAHPLGGQALARGRFSYQFEPRSEYLNAVLSVNAEQRFEFQFKADLDIGSEQLELQHLAEAGLGALQLEYLNRGSQRALMQACGAVGSSGLVEGPYVAKHSKVVKHRLLLQGWRSSDDLEFAYQDYLFQPVKLALALRSRHPRPWQQQLFGPSSWQGYQTQVVLNRYQTPGQALQWQLPESASAPVQQPLAALEPLALIEPLDDEAFAAAIGAMPLVETEPPATIQQDYQPSYKPVSIDQLKGHIGDPLRLTTHNGRRMQGVLERLESDRLQLRRDVAQGVAVLPVRLDIISSVQAYY